MDRKCRLCLKYCEPEGTTTIADEMFRQKMLDVFSFPVEIGTHLPSMVCGKCMILIEDFHTFCGLVQANQRHLKLQLKDETQQELFEVVKVETFGKDGLFVAETEDYKAGQSVESGPTQANNDSKSIRDCVEEAEIEPEAGRHDPFLVTAARRRRTKDSMKIDTISGDRKLRRNAEDQRMLEYYKMDCEICSTRLNTFADLQSHFRKVHNTTGYIRCCDKVLTRRAKLMEHILVHEGSLRCDVCQKTYKCSRSLNMHKLNSHTSVGDRPFKCDKCHQSYPKQHLLTAHLVRHVQERCPICEKTLSSSQALKVHVAQVHGEDSKKNCATCGKEFRTKRAMDRHMNEHLGLELVQKVQCHMCEKWFNGKYNLKKHIRFIHIEEGQEFQCEICNHKYPNTRALVYHKQRVHVEEKFECEYCGKRFKRKIYLKEHIASHTRQPLYSCDMCEATFNSNGNLYAHRRSKHAAEWKASKQPPSSEMQSCV